ncbi:MAG TPA: hypothetical protein VJQ08_10590 [Candidatus Dormibacteraeota bacterium]|nr:hypothetical protein [Candidatus Dormibacteraeota bacterium]
MSVEVLAVDGLVGVAGAVLAVRWPLPGGMVLAIAGLVAVVALFSTTLLEIGVAVLLLGAAAATLYLRLVRG